MRHVFLVVVLLLVAGCSNGGGNGQAGCKEVSDCERFSVCDLIAGKCVEVPCAINKDCGDYGSAFCLKADEATEGVCSPIECGKNKPCGAGFECVEFICLEAEPACEVNSDCAMPVEKCYKGECKLANYCESHGDCPSGECNLDSSTCVNEEMPDVVDGDTGGEKPDIGECDPNDFESPTTYLCAECVVDEQCGCGLGKCIDVSGEKRCSVECSTEEPCPSGYRCEESVCLPYGSTCKGCIVPPGCTEPGKTCSFKDGTCVDKTPWCSPCNFDWQCGFGSRCYVHEDGSLFCAPECSKDGFSCPLSSGCQIREDGIYICVYTGDECCYGLDCECQCGGATPYCYEDPVTEKTSCVQCYNNPHCPPDKPVCDKETFTCGVFCTAPTPVIWHDPATGKDVCVECVKSLDCPPPAMCGTFEGDPATYHKCYQP